MARTITIQTQAGENVTVTCEKHGYRTRLWTSFRGIGYIGSYFPSQRIARVSTDFKGVTIVDQVMVTGIADAAKELLPHFIRVLDEQPAAQPEA